MNLKNIPLKPRRYDYDSEAEFEMHLKWWERDYGKLIEDAKRPSPPEPPTADEEDHY